MSIPATVAITPSQVVLVGLAMQTFVATLSGISGSVVWSVDGIVGGNSMVGTIVGGVYTAPSTTGKHVVTATVTSGATTVFANASINLQAYSPAGIGSLTFGSHLTGGSYNGTSPATIATDATSANTPSTLVSRDAGGNASFTTVNGALTGNATTATSTAAISGMTATQVPIAASATSIASSVPATSANTPSTIVARDASGNFSAGQITAATLLAGILQLSALPPIYANNAAAIAGGLTVGGIYRSGADPDILAICH